MSPNTSLNIYSIIFSIDLFDLNEISSNKIVINTSNVIYFEKKIEFFIVGIFFAFATLNLKICLQSLLVNVFDTICLSIHNLTNDEQDRRWDESAYLSNTI
jgi:hypothetical protein